ncbi:hypothetical protein KY290_000546 [Solanum tuberosum]|uniref:Uncharacterized protein n=1 Tax=Solanum tuberosum TaxID=4113 RepID=A0ABQ7WJR7_SOLTU|nr:hypothetical protein KY290_000546 [Solanum tuberosum]
MAWTFEVIPHLRHQVTIAEEEISSPRILRWELLGATTIKRARLDDQQLVVFNEDDMVDMAVRAGVNIGVGAGVSVGPGVGFGVQSVGATSCSRCSGFLCEKCKKHDEVSIMYLQTLSQAVNEFKNKRGIKVIPSKNVRDPYTPQAKSRKKPFIKAIQNLKKKIFEELPMAIGEKLLELKHVNLFKCVPIAQKNKLVELMRGKDLRVQYGMHIFSGDDFRTMTSMNNCLMRERHLRYPKYYDSIDRIVDLNFYTNFKKRGIRPYPKGMGWIGAKRILAVMNLNKTHFVTLEILLHECPVDRSIGTRGNK